MTPARLAKLLIEGPRIIAEDSAGNSAGFGPLSVLGQEDSATPPVAQSPNGVEYPEGKAGEDRPRIDKRIGVYMNRAALRLFSVPSFQTYWKDTVLFSDTDAKDGRCRIQFVFHRLPEEAHPLLVKLLAAPNDPKFTRFVDKGQARTGVELDVSPEDFGGEEYDYAF